MNHTATYEVDESLHRASLNQYFFTVLIRPIAPVFAVIAVYFITILFIEFPYRDWTAIAIGALLFFLSAVWIKSYFAMQAQGRDGLKLLSHPTITISLSDDQIQYSSSTGDRRVDWVKIDRFCETKDFMVFQSGKVPLLILPKRAFAADMYEFIKEKMKDRKSPAKR